MQRKRSTDDGNEPYQHIFLHHRVPTILEPLLNKLFRPNWLLLMLSDALVSSVFNPLMPGGNKTVTHT